MQAIIPVNSIHSYRFKNGFGRGRPFLSKGRYCDALLFSTVFALVAFALAVPVLLFDSLASLQNKIDHQATWIYFVIEVEGFSLYTKFERADDALDRNVPDDGGFRPALGVRLYEPLAAAAPPPPPIAPPLDWLSCEPVKLRLRVPASDLSEMWRLMISRISQLQNLNDYHQLARWVVHVFLSSQQQYLLLIHSRKKKFIWLKREYE